MSLVRLLGFSTLPCGCVVGRYVELPGNREVVYVEEKGSDCTCHAHRRNHAVPRARGDADKGRSLLAVARAS